MHKYAATRILLYSFFFLLIISCSSPTPEAIQSTETFLPPPVTATIASSPAPDPTIISPENASQLVLKFMNMGRAVGFPSFSPDGKWLYQASTVGIYAFDTVSYQDIHLLTFTPAEMLVPDAHAFTGLEPSGFVDHEKSIFSPDGSLIAGYFGSDFTTVWRLADRKLINQFDGQPKEISPDNSLITIGRSEYYETHTRYYLDLYDLQTGKQLGSWSASQASFLSDNQLAVESSDGYTRIYDPITRKVPHAFAGWHAAFSPDEQNVAVLYGNQIHVYHISDDKLIYKFDSGLTSTDDANLLFSANGEILAGFTTEYYCCTGYSNRLFVWRLSDGRLLADLSQPEGLGQYAEPPFSLSPDGQMIVIDLRVLRISDGVLVKDLMSYFINTVTNLAFTVDGQKIIVLDNYEKVHLYPVENGMLGIPQNADQETYLPFLQSASGISSEDVIDVPSPDGKFIARRNMGVVTISSISNTGELFQIPAYEVKCFTFSPDGQILALGLPDGSVELWDVYNSQKIYTLPVYTEDSTNSVGGLAFSPDGKQLAVGLLDGTVRLYGLNTR